MVATVTCGARIDVLLQHLAVIHFVDVVAGENDGVVGTLAADGIDILVNGVRGAEIPTGGDAHLRRQDFDEVAESHQRRPPQTNMAVQAERLVLRENENAAQVAIDAIGQRDVDDAVNAAERDGGFGAVAGERPKPLPLAAGQKDTDGVAH